MRLNSILTKFIVILLLVSTGSLFNYGIVRSAPVNINPKLATVYLGSPLTSKEVTALAQWDVVILHMLDQVKFAKEIKQIRALHPGIIILAYVPSEEFPISMYKQWEPDPNGLWHKLLAGITPEMWLLNQKGEHVVFWGNNWMLNNTNYATANKRWNEYLSDFVNREILSTGLWDGIFYDNTWTGISWIQNGAIDANHDGVNDLAANLDTNWEQGMRTLFSLTRQKAGKPIVLVGNGDRGFYNDLNGLYIEDFTRSQNPDWADRMRFYTQAASQSRAPAIAIVGNTAATQTDYSRMRFGLASALMQDGYYSFDRQDSHAEIWWYDEYGVKLGAPVDSAVAASGKTTYNTNDVWRRDFTAGIALANPTNTTTTIDLGGEFEKIIGTQDPKTNNGAIVSSVALGARDGLLMLKTFQTVSSSVVDNGAFVRFFRLNGQRARNGFFVFEQNLPGNAKVYNGDLNGDGTQEKIVARGAKLEIFNARGERWFDGYPFGANYKGELNIAVAPMNGSNEMSIAVAPTFGNSVMLYSYYGAALKTFYPLGKNYKYGFSVALGKTGKSGETEVIVTPLSNTQTEVLFINTTSDKISGRFSPYGRTKTPAFIATGDFVGNGQDQVATIATINGQPLVRVFDAKGKKISEFKVSGLFTAKPLKLSAADVTNEGKKEIVVLSND